LLLQCFVIVDGYCFQHEVRSVSTFLASGRNVDTRNIGTEHWPLKLNVQFFESSPDDYYAKACIVTERTGQSTCFLNSTYSKAGLMSECATERLGVSSSLPMLLLTVMMIVLFLTIGVGIVFLTHHLFVRISRATRNSRKFHKKSQCTALLPSMHNQKMSIEEDRLTVIEEEKEESSRISPSPSSSGFESDLRGISFNSCDSRAVATEPLQTMSMSCSVLHTFRPAPHPL
uniref:ZP domain-containing protein n=1 Tax=Nippostrongylus brasiliensis TaxID=27835 RepID=A0A0N4YP05_NIPBR